MAVEFGCYLDFDVGDVECVVVGVVESELGDGQSVVWFG